MASEQNEIVEQLTDAGNHLLKLPTSRDEILKLLEDLGNILSKVDQAPSQEIQKALLPAMKALISDQILKNSDSDIKITVAVCFNEIMRVTAPDSPYDDSRMKEIFELIIASFDNLSLLSGISYTKALSIIDNVAKVRSCVMMLDIECDKLIIEMFEQFKRNLRPDHPPSVFLAMEEIMTHVINESEDIPLELLKVLLDCVRKEKENTSPMSWGLGGKVIKRTSEKLKPYLRDAVKSGDISKDDYAPIIDSMLKCDSKIVKPNHVADTTNQLVSKESTDDALILGDAIKSGDAVAKPVLSNASEKTDVKVETQKNNDKTFSDEGFKAPVTKPLASPPKAPSTKPLASPPKAPPTKPLDSPPKAPSTKPLTSPPQGLSKKSSSVAVKNNNAPKDVAPRKEKELADRPEKTNNEISSDKPNLSGKKLGRPKKDASGGSGKKKSSSNSGTGSSENGMNELGKKVLRRKRDQMEDEVFETPFGKKKYKEDIIGCKLKVWWPKDKMYYEGRVTSYNPSTRKHRVEYDDGDVEILNLVNEKFEFIGDEIAVFESKTDVKPNQSSERKRPKKDPSAKKAKSSAKKAEAPKSSSKESEISDSSAKNSNAA